MGWSDNCLFWQAISRLIAVQYYCQSLITAATAQPWHTDTSMYVCLYLCVRVRVYFCAGSHVRKLLKCTLSLMCVLCVKLFALIFQWQTFETTENLFFIFYFSFPNILIFRIYDGFKTGSLMFSHGIFKISVIVAWSRRRPQPIV